MHSRAEELCKLLSDPKTYVYLAGLEKIRDELNDVLAEIAGSNQTWFHWKAELEADHRWIELLY
jgi:ferredoxin--NADP+ reductase